MIRTERVSTSDWASSKFHARLFSDYKLPFDFKRYVQSIPNGCELWIFCFLKKYERSEYLINAFIFEYHKQYLLKKLPLEARNELQ